MLARGRGPWRFVRYSGRPTLRRRLDVSIGTWRLGAKQLGSTLAAPWERHGLPSRGGHTHAVR